MDSGEELYSGASTGIQEKLQHQGHYSAIVKSGSTYYALSCDHVMKSEDSRRIVHPGHYDHLKYPKLRRSISKWSTSSL